MVYTGKVNNGTMAVTPGSSPVSPGAKATPFEEAQKSQPKADWVRTAANVLMYAGIGIAGGALIATLILYLNGNISADIGFLESTGGLGVGSVMLITGAMLHGSSPAKKPKEEEKESTALKGDGDLQKQFERVSS